MLGGNDENNFFGSQFSNIEKAVQNALGEAYKRIGLNQKGVFFNSEVFETHESVIAKIKIPKGVKLNDLRVLVNGHHIKLEELSRNDTQFIKLPAHGNIKTAKAMYRNGTLQVVMKKYNKSDPYREVHIRLS